jgi:uncharacterized protein GlcG (DUF336 family)
MIIRRLTLAAIALGAIVLSSHSASAQLVEKKTLSLAAAKKMAAAAEAEAVKNNWFMVITVLDDGGNLLYLERMDGAQLGSLDVSQRKARTALRFRRPSKDFEDAIAAGRVGIVTIPDVAAVQGGLPVMLDGKAIGAIGVSGAKSDQDAQCAKAGLTTVQ